MEYSIEAKGRFTVIALEGEIDLYFSPQARDVILKCLHEKHAVLIDLSQVSYLDSSGVASLVEGYQLAKRDGLDFALVGVGPAAMQVFQLARLDRVFPIYDTLAAALVEQS